MFGVLRQSCLCAIACLLCGIQGASAASLFAVEFSREGELLSVDTTTGATTIVGRIDTGVKNLAFDSRRQVFFASDSILNLYRIDPQNADIEFVARMNLPVPNSPPFGNNMAYDPMRDALFSVMGGSLVRVNPITAETTVIADLDDPLVQGLTYDAINDRLIAATIAPFTFEPRIRFIDPDTGDSTFIEGSGFPGMTPGDIPGPELGPTFEVHGLAMDPVSGVLFGVERNSDQLITIDLATGESKAIGPLGFPTVSSLTLGPSPVPLPPAVALFGAALGSLAFFSSARRRRLSREAMPGC